MVIRPALSPPEPTTSKHKKSVLMLPALMPTGQCSSCYRIFLPNKEAQREGLRRRCRLTGCTLAPHTLNEVSKSHSFQLWVLRSRLPLVLTQELLDVKSIRSSSNLAKPVSRSSSKTSNAWGKRRRHDKRVSGMRRVWRKQNRICPGESSLSDREVEGSACACA